VLLDRVAPTSLEIVRDLHAAGQRVVLLDDFGEGRAAADLVIDPPTGTGWPRAGGVDLNGFEHVLLRDEVVKTLRSASTSGVLVAMGGSDPHGLTVPLSRALSEMGLQVSAALGPGYSGEEPPAGITRVGPDRFLHTLAAARLLITAYGHTLLEAAYLGVPAVAAVLHADQVIHARAFGANGTAAILDAWQGAGIEEVATAAVTLLNDPPRYEAMAARGPALIDGRGAQRVARAIEELA
jgi:UDP-2,4-diacetamido-2,4,6-trideoxy-beta-L-altropyranose hydrolase